jgi:hypothetical protein
MPTICVLLETRRWQPRARTATCRPMWAHGRLPARSLGIGTGRGSLAPRNPLQAATRSRSESNSLLKPFDFDIAIEDGPAGVAGLESESAFTHTAKGSIDLSLSRSAGTSLSSAVTLSLIFTTTWLPSTMTSYLNHASLAGASSGIALPQVVQLSCVGVNSRRSSKVCPRDNLDRVRLWG